MRFVHLTPQPVIGRVKRSGIRQGGGRRGRGVYAVPLMEMAGMAISPGGAVRDVTSISTVKLWQWLRRWGRHRHRHLAAVIFRVGQIHWPADLYLEVSPEVGTDWLDTAGIEEEVVASDDREFVRNANRGGAIADLKVTAHKASDIGRVLAGFKAAGHRVQVGFDESIEVVFRSPVPPRMIERIVPLYRSNRQFQRARTKVLGE